MVGVGGWAGRSPSPSHPPFPASPGHAPYRAIAYAIFQAILSLDAADSNK